MIVTTAEQAEKLFIFLKSRSKFGGITISIDDIAKNSNFPVTAAIALLKILKNSGRIVEKEAVRKITNKEKITYIIL